MNVDKDVNVDNDDVYIVVSCDGFDDLDAVNFHERQNILENSNAFDDDAIDEDIDVVAVDEHYISMNVDKEVNVDNDDVYSVVSYDDGFDDLDGIMNGDDKGWCYEF